MNFHRNQFHSNTWVYGQTGIWIPRFSTMPPPTPPTQINFGDHVIWVRRPNGLFEPRSIPYKMLAFFWIALGGTKYWYHCKEKKEIEEFRKCVKGGLEELNQGLRQAEGELKETKNQLTETNQHLKKVNKHLTLQEARKSRVKGWIQSIVAWVY